MRSWVRFSLLALLVGVLVAAVAPAAQAAEAPAIETLVAVNCKVEKCAQTEINAGEPFGAAFGPQVYIEPKAPTVKQAEEEGFLQAGGRVPFGITDFKVATTGTLPTARPTAVVEHLRTDVAPGLATNPTAVADCPAASFGTTEPLPGSGFYPAPTCNEEAGNPKADTVIGKQHATAFLQTNETTGEGIDLALEGTVYNLEPATGLASEFGVSLKLPKGVTKPGLEKYFAALIAKGIPVPELSKREELEAGEYFAHTLIEGNVEWGQQAKGTGQGDYHDYFEINVSPTLPLISSRLNFEGTKGNGDFITNATSCPGHNTTTLKLTDVEKATIKTEYTTPVGLYGCSAATEKDPFGTKFTNQLAFEPSFALASGSTLSDEPNEITTAIAEPQNPKVNAQSQVKTASITMPEGMTLNPSAANGLEACTPKQARIHGEAFGVECPAASAVGTVSLEVPTLPPGSLTGTAYLGAPESGPITGPPYILYVVANSTRYGVSVRLKGEVVPNEATGQLTTIFQENPEQPFSNLSIHFNRGALTSIANPLVCGTPTGSTSFTPVAGVPASTGAAFGVSVTGCPSPLPFALAQGTFNQTTTAGGRTNFTFNLSRGDGNQYLSQVKTTLPEGIVGAIPTVTQCTEAQASTNTCPATSIIGAASAVSGSGPAPFHFGGGLVFLTGPYKGAPYGLSIVVPAVAGPFNLGPVTTRATLTIDPYTDRVTTTSVIPTIVKGIPTRLRGLSVTINKQGFLYNPTNCNLSATESVLTSTLGATQSLSTPLQVGSCSALKFKPSFKATTSGKTSKANGASLETTINEVAGQANIKSVLVQLPKALPSRLTTLQKACTEAQFNADPFKCPSGSFVGGARANTPLLPSKLTGPAILVSHGGAAFPDLDLVLEANGVRTILVGNTDIKKGITTTNFATTPDVPVSSITVNLPIGSHSALAANTNLCANALIMPTTITGQNGTIVKQNTTIAPKGCGVRIVGHKVAGNTAILTVQTYESGRISGKGANSGTVFRRLSGAKKTAQLRVPLSRGGRSKRKPLKVRLRVGFVPKAKKGKTSVAFVTVTFR